MCDDQNMPKEQDILRDIEQAFGQASPPSRPEEWKHWTDDIRSIHYSEAIEETYRLWDKSWADLTLDDFEECSRAFTFLPKEHVPYFLGAVMVLSLQTEPYSPEIFELFTLFDPSDSSRRRAVRTLAFNALQIKGLNPLQLQTIVAFLQLLEAAGIADERSAYMQKYLRERLS